MQLNQDEKLLIESRAKLLAYWPIAAGLVTALLAGLAVWLVLLHPLLANPFHVMSELDKGSLPASTLVVMAAILPFMTLTMLGVAGTLLIFAFVSIRREKKYLEIISRLTVDKDGDAD